MKCEACGYQFLFASSTQCPSCGDPREAIVKESDIQAAMDALRADTVSVVGPWKEPDDGVFVWGNAPSQETNARTELQNVPVIPWTAPVLIMESTVGLKAANAHMARRVAELEAEAEKSRLFASSRRDIVAQNIPPVGALQPLNAEAWFEIAMAYQFEIEDLTRQLAAQALAHAEQMEGMRASMPKKSGSQLYAEMMGQAVDQCELTNLHRELASARAFIERLKAAELSAMRVTPATQPTDAQQTAGDASATVSPERRPDGTLKPVAKAWEAPKQVSDARRIGS